jgi:hypothetical protein
MRRVLIAGLLGVLSICQLAAASSASSSTGTPNLAELQLVAQLPAELPQRITGLTYDGEKLWAAIYLDHGRYATLDPATLKWTISNDQKAHRAIAEVSGSFESPSGICFVNGKLWVAGSYGDSYGSIDVHDWKIEQVFKRKQVADRASQTYSSMAYDGAHIWIAWQWFRYSMPISETQMLLKVDPTTGEVVEKFPAPAGTRNDSTHGLAWDGSTLWHIKDNTLSSISTNGQVIDQYRLGQLKRPSGLAWDGHALWISEFDGKIWRLPF